MTQETAVEREALKPCAFCGGGDIRHEPLDFQNGSWVMCESCGGSTDAKRSNSAAIKAWNLRAAPPIAPGEREALIARVRKYAAEDDFTDRDGQANTTIRATAIREMANLLEKSIAAKAQAPAEPVHVEDLNALRSMVQRYESRMQDWKDAPAYSQAIADHAASFKAMERDLGRMAENGVFARLLAALAAPKAPAENTTPVVQAELRKFLAALDQMSEGGNVCPGWNYHHSKRVVRAAIDAIASDAGKAPTPGVQDKDAFCWREFCRMVMDTDRNNEHGYLALMKLIEHGYEMDVRIAGLAEAGKAPAQPAES